jgi:hypothetical protein
VDHLTSVGVSEMEKAEHTVKDLDASKLTIELTNTPRPVPELNSKETWSCRACSDHSKSLIRSLDTGFPHSRMQFNELLLMDN